MGPPNIDSRVDAFIEDLPEWQREICAKARYLIHEAEPEIEETIKRGDRPYFTLSGNICAFQATKDHINIFIYDPIAPDPHGIINQGEGNVTARAIQIFKGQFPEGKAFRNLISAVAANNRAGGWRKLKKTELN